MTQYKKGLRGTHEFALNTKLYGAYLRFQNEMIDIDSYDDFEYLVDEHLGEFCIILSDYAMRMEKKIEILLSYFKHGKSKVIFIAGARDCLPKGTMIRTCCNYSRPIEKVTQVESYNFEKRKKEINKAKVFGPFKKKIWKIYTEEGVVECSGEHKWYIKREGKIIVVPTNEINPKKDVLLKHTKIKEQTGQLNSSWKKNVISDDELRKLYVDEKKSMEEIAKIKKTSWDTIKRRLLRLRIKIRGYNEAQHLGIKKKSWIDSHTLNPNSKKGNRKIYLKIAKENYPWICSKCGTSQSSDGFDLIVHHKDENNKNNSINNLQILCQPCHAKIHNIGHYERN